MTEIKGVIFRVGQRRPILTLQLRGESSPSFFSSVLESLLAGLLRRNMLARARQGARREHRVQCSAKKKRANGAPSVITDRG